MCVFPDRTPPMFEEIRVVFSGVAKPSSMPFAPRRSGFIVMHVGCEEIEGRFTKSFSRCDIDGLCRHDGWPCVSGVDLVFCCESDVGIVIDELETSIMFGADVLPDKLSDDPGTAVRLERVPASETSASAARLSLKDVFGS